jgi:hypothetical protein
MGENYLQMMSIQDPKRNGIRVRVRVRVKIRVTVKN